MDAGTTTLICPIGTTVPAGTTLTIAFNAVNPRSAPTSWASRPARTPSRPIRQGSRSSRVRPSPASRPGARGGKHHRSGVLGRAHQFGFDRDERLRAGSWEYVGNQTPQIPTTTGHGTDDRCQLSYPDVTEGHGLDRLDPIPAPDVGAGDPEPNARLRFRHFTAPDTVRGTQQLDLHLFAFDSLWKASKAQRKEGCTPSVARVPVVPPDFKSFRSASSSSLPDWFRHSKPMLKPLRRHTGKIS
jgi:hypothetical protein